MRRRRAIENDRPKPELTLAQIREIMRAENIPTGRLLRNTTTMNAAQGTSPIIGSGTKMSFRYLDSIHLAVLLQLQQTLSVYLIRPSTVDDVRHKYEHADADCYNCNVFPYAEYDPWSAFSSANHSAV